MMERFRSSKKQLISLKRKSVSQENMKVVSPGIDSKDVRFLAQGSEPMSQNQILKMHVKNHSELDLRQRRKVIAHIQSQRAMHAKEVFLKELASVGGTLTNLGEGKGYLARQK
mmetsp:Transcript_1370/g.2422  ORF Transcript_1370/g.2422 Transcript_1370/m.2422 type:complete len:113 (-) Transcript_1370:46-384(-)